ncbi:MAG: tRNA (guanosine(37)-N1)-methyltransferase TrmD [Parcubacteria group bacterium]|jgi:tRNA (guanine37-N1)-methyltransferase|nr:tRNA (guanosine(37)-N1)-methyltransferase TrmD [Parcubacteria group bacterium]
MTFHIITLFPHLFDSYLSESILGRAQKNKKVKVQFYNPRDFVKPSKTQAKNEKPYLRIDAKPYGGGAGMILQAEPILKAVQKIEKKIKNRKKKIVIFSAKGKTFNQKMAHNWANKYQDIVFITGRYEGIDERVKKALRAEEVSIGPYVLTDGDIASMVAYSAVVRLIPGVIKLESLEEESHWNLLLKNEKKNKLGENGLEYPHYTRPEVLEYKGKKYRVPKILLSGNHKKIEEWRKKNR